MTMGEMIRQLRTAKGMSQEELGKLCGVNRAAVNKWETGTTENIKRSTIKSLSEIFVISPTKLLGLDEPEEDEPDSNEIPLYGMVACGSGASMAILENISKPSFVQADCAFRTIGESMSSCNIHSGDVVFVQSGIHRDGEIHVVRIADGYYLKRLYRASDGFMLISDEPPITVSGEQEDYEVIGKAVYLLQQI